MLIPRIRITSIGGLTNCPGCLSSLGSSLIEHTLGTSVPVFDYIPSELQRSLTIEETPCITSEHCGVHSGVVVQAVEFTLVQLS